MTSAIDTRLAAQFDSHSIERQIHDVPPHEVYEVRVEGRRAVYKTNTGPTGSAGIEGRVTAFVDEETTVPVPEVLCVGEEYYVAAWHPEAPSPGETQSPERWADPAGRGLARLHEQTAPEIAGYGQLQSAGDGVASTGHEDFHDAAIEYVRHYRPSLERYGHDDIADLVLAFLEDNPDAFAGTGEAVLCHGWATPEHISVVDDEVACLVDFEHAIAAPGEFEFWRTVGPAFESEAVAETFRDGYESVRELPDGFEDRKQLYQLLNGVYFFVSLYVQNQHDQEQTAEIAGRLREQVTGLVEELQ